MHDSDPAERPQRPDERPGAVIGPYVLERRIGEGGFGSVWLAEQSQPVRRHVALKILKAGMDSEQVVRRFGAERQALARMDHPCIAKVFDAGVTERERPYFVMEYVEGQPITTHCDDGRLSPRARLQLFRDVCLGVQHAHRRGIVHRDIKPSNVMVSTVDGKPLPKIIDFGIVKAVDRPLTEQSIVTEVRQVIGTPEYMAPEQADGRGDVDTRADVYSLGVLLYELLTGTKPFELTSVIDKGYDEVLRHIREVDPAKPSTRVSSLGEGVDAIASMRSETPRGLRKAFRGDLDWIVLKALEKDRERRYGSASELADEVDRYLADEPVTASPPSTLYRLNKFARRNRALFAAGVTIAGALVAAVGILGWSLARVSDERDTADLARKNELDARLDAERALVERNEALEEKLAALAQEEAARAQAEDALARMKEAFAEAEVSLAEAEAATDFLSSMLGSVDPWQDGRDVRVYELLDRSGENLDEHFAGQPRVEARLRRTIGSAYRNLGLLDEADAHLPRALELARSTLEPGEERVLDGLDALAQLREDQARFDEAEELAQELLAQAKAQGDERTAAWALATLAMVHGSQGLMDQAEAEYAIALPALEEAYGEDHERSLVTLSNYAVVLTQKGRQLEAAPILERLVELRERKHGPDHPFTLSARHNRAALWERQGRLAEAEAESREVLEGRRRAFGTDHPATIDSLQSFGIRLRSQGNYAEAEPLLRESVEASRRVLGAEHHVTARGLRHLGICLWLAGRPAEAEEPLREALELCIQLQGVDHPDTFETRNVLAIVHFVTGHLDEAREEWETLLSQQLAVFGEDDAHANRSKANLGMVYAELARYDEAEALYAEALESFRRVGGDDTKSVRDLLNNLGILYNAAQRYEEAYEAFSEVVDLRTRLLGPTHPLTLGSRGGLATALIGLGRDDEALAILSEVLASERTALGSSHPNVGQTLLILGELNLRRGELALAEAHVQEALEVLLAAYDEEHHSVLGAHQLLGATHLEADRPAEAVPHLTAACEGRERTLGAEHPSTLESLITLARALAATGDDVTARQTAERALERMTPEDRETQTVEGLLESR